MPTYNNTASVLADVTVLSSKVTILAVLESIWLIIRFSSRPFIILSKDKHKAPNSSVLSEFILKEKFSLLTSLIPIIKALTGLIKNTDVKVIGESGNWYKVKYEDITGYIRKDLLSDEKQEVTSRGNIDRQEEKTEEKQEPKTTTTETSSNSSLGEQIVAYAKQYLGCPYVYGGSGPNSFDCSGFTMYVYKHFGYSMAHGAISQSKLGTYVAKEDLRPGDLVFFLEYQTMDEIGHVGIYIGNGEFIHASSGSGYCVKISTLESGSYLKRYDTARRIF